MAVSASSAQAQWGYTPEGWKGSGSTYYDREQERLERQRIQDEKDAATRYRVQRDGGTRLDAERQVIENHICDLERSLYGPDGCKAPKRITPTPAPPKQYPAMNGGKPTNMLPPGMSSDGDN